MPTVRTYDDVDVLFKKNDDGESVRHLSVIGKESYEKALADGWTDISQLPHMPYPRALYKPNGMVKRVENRKEHEAAMLPCNADCAPGCISHNWEIKVYAAPPLPPETWPTTPSVQVVTNDNGSMDLALKLLEANERAAVQAKEFAALQATVAELLSAQKKTKQSA